MLGRRGRSSRRRGTTFARHFREGVRQLRLVDTAIAAIIDPIEQPIELPLETTHPVPFMAIVFVAVHTVMTMVMACASATQECHRTLDKFFFGDRAVLV